jgi:hypothetical protein
MYISIYLYLSICLSVYISINLSIFFLSTYVSLFFFKQTRGLQLCVRDGVASSLLPVRMYAHICASVLFAIKAMRDHENMSSADAKLSRHTWRPPISSQEKDSVKPD